MMPKVFFASALALSMASLPFTTPAQADGHNDLIAGIALGVLGSAVAHHHHSHGSEYQPHPALTPEENAVGLCMHRTKTAMTNQGYYAVDFVQTLEYKANSDGIDLVDIEAVRSSDRNDARSHFKAHCAIQDDKVVHIKFSSV